MISASAESKFTIVCVMCTSKELALICDATVRVWAMLSYSRGSAAHTSWGCTTGPPAQFISFAWKPLQIVDCAAIRCHHVPPKRPRSLENIARAMNIWTSFVKFRTSGGIRSLQEGLVVYLSHLRYLLIPSSLGMIQFVVWVLCPALNLQTCNSHTHAHASTSNVSPRKNAFSSAFDAYVN